MIQNNKLKIKLFPLFLENHLEPAEDNWQFICELFALSYTVGIG